MVLETVFALVLWDAVASARGDVFSQVKMISQHSTEQVCETALTAYVEKRAASMEKNYPMQSILSCQKVTSVNYVGKAPDPESWGSWLRRH